MAEVRAKLAPGTPVEVWFQDEMRVGQKNKLTYRWAKKGSRPRATHDQRTQSTYLFGAVCPEYGTGAALVLPFCNTEAMTSGIEARGRFGKQDFVYLIPFPHQSDLTIYGKDVMDLTVLGLRSI